MVDLRDLNRLSRADGEARIRNLCQSQYLGKRRILARCLGRYKIFLDGDDVVFAPHILLDGYWEYWITQFMIATVKPGMAVIDVGANFGYFSVLLADLVGPYGHVVAVEPNPHVTPFLRDTLFVNGFARHARVEEAALGREPRGELPFHLPENNPLESHVVRPDEATHGPGRTISVRATCIDELASELDRLDFVKVDAEGAEADILEGMVQTVKRLRPEVLLEFNVRRSYDAARFLAKLQSMFSHVAYIDFDGRRKEVTMDEVLSRNDGQDWMLYCSHEPRRFPDYSRFLINQREC
ncbi:MAG: FkbM family methyltransferase [Xanthobacteraceae bacterium]|nr:FkbM family methyltransferase [Xanthobacteraceae bacterium]